MAGRLLSTRASEADQQAWELALRPKACLLAHHEQLRTMVASKLLLDWSPEQISGWFEEPVSQRRESARVPRNDLSQPVHSSARSAEKGTGKAATLAAADSPLAIRQHSRTLARARSSTPFRSASDLPKSKIVPSPVTGRAICCAGRATASSNLRWSSVIQRFCMLVKVPGKDTATVVAALSQHVRQLPATLRRSLTYGIADWRWPNTRASRWPPMSRFTSAIRKSPQQRGSNENTNGLLRQYLPKKADLSCYSQSELDEIALRLNQRPRKTLRDLKLRRINSRPVLHRPLETTPFLAMSGGECRVRRQTSPQIEDGQQVTAVRRTGSALGACGSRASRGTYYCDANLILACIHLTLSSRSLPSSPPRSRLTPCM